MNMNQSRWINIQSRSCSTITRLAEHSESIFSSEISLSLHRLNRFHLNVGRTFTSGYANYNKMKLSVGIIAVTQKSTL